LEEYICLIVQAILKKNHNVDLRGKGALIIAVIHLDLKEGVSAIVVIHLDLRVEVLAIAVIHLDLMEEASTVGIQIDPRIEALVVVDNEGHLVLGEGSS